MKTIIYVNERNGVVCKGYPNAQAYVSLEFVHTFFGTSTRQMSFKSFCEAVEAAEKGGEQ